MVPYRMGKSKIQGMGIIATHPIKKGEIIPMPSMTKAWIHCGGFNHSCTNNISDRIPGQSAHEQKRTALRDIQVGEELTVSYHTRPVSCNCETHRYKR